MNANNMSAAVELTSVNDSSVSDEIQEPYFPEYLRTTSTLLCSIIMMTGIVGNILVPVVLWKNKELRSSTNIFLVNLSFADLLIMLVCMPPVLVELHSKPEVWVLGAAMCKIVPFAELSVAHASVLTILAISLERYIAICRPLRANYTCTKHRAFALCIGIWILALVATSPVLVIAQQEERMYFDQTTQKTCLTQALTTWALVYFLSSIVIFFFVPLFVLIALYWTISRHLMSDPSVANNRCCPDHPNMRARRQVVVMLGTVVAFFFVCLLPFRLFTLFIILFPSSYVESMGQGLYYNILYITRAMLYLNSAVNPILYNVMSSKFRDAFSKVLGCPINNPRRRWLSRHLSRQSTFTTSSTVPTSSFKSTTGVFNGTKCCHNNGGSVKFRDLVATEKGKHPTAMKTASGPYYPSPPKRQVSSDASVVHTHLLREQQQKKAMLRANSVV